MSQEGQPRDPRIQFYFPENWLPLSPEEGGQQFVNFPITQTAQISFPGAILCSNLKSFAPSAPMNLYNDSTTGSIEIANNFGYTGGIVINSNAVAPVSNTIRIGDTDRPVIMPKVKLTDVEPNMITVAGVPVILPVYINSNTTIASGKDFLVNEIKPATTSTVSLPNGATTTAPATSDPGSSRVVTSQWVRDQNYTTTAGFVTYNGTSPFTTRQTFNTGITVESIIPPSGFDISLSSPTTPTPSIPNTTTRMPNCEWVNTTIGNALVGYARYALTTAFTVLQTFNLGIKTNSVALVSGTELTLPASTVPSITAPDNTTRVANTAFVTTSITNALNATTLFARLAGTTAFTALQTFNLGIKTNSVALVSGTELTLPASTTTAPGDTDTSSRVVSSQWVRNQGYVSAIASDVTYDGVGPFTTVQTFTSGIKTTEVQGTTTTSLLLGSNQTSGGTITLGSSNTTFTADGNFGTIKGTAFNSFSQTGTVSLGSGQLSGGIVRVGTLSNSTIQIQGESVTLEGTVRSNNLTGYSTSSSIGIGTDQVAGGTIVLGSTLSEITNYGTFKTNAISLVSGTSLALPAATTAVPATSDNTTLIPTTSWVNSAITTALATLSGFATYNGTSPFTTLQTFNGGVTINSTATPLTITASTKAETYTAGGASAPTMKVFTGNTTGASALSTTFYRFSANGITTVNPFRIFTTSGVATAQYMELTVSGISTRSPGAPNIFATKACFVIHNFNNNDTAGQINIANITYPTQYSSNFNNATISVSLSSLTELRIFINLNTGNVTRQNMVATLVAYPSIGASGANTNFTITAPTF